MVERITELKALKSLSGLFKWNRWPHTMRVGLDLSRSGGRACVSSPLTLNSFAAKIRTMPMINKFSPIFIVNSSGDLIHWLRLQISTKSATISRVVSPQRALHKLRPSCRATTHDSIAASAPCPRHETTKLGRVYHETDEAGFTSRATPQMFCYFKIISDN